MTSETFGAVESHVEDALLAAQDLAQGEPVNAGHVLGGVLAVVRMGSNSAAFQALARLVPDLPSAELPAERTLTLSPECFSAAFLSSLESVRSVLSEEWDRAMLWGRDLITAALLAQQEQALGGLLSRQLGTLRDAWYEFLARQAELPEAAYEAIWRRARVDLPSQAAPGGETQLLFVQHPTSIWIRKVQRKPWALEGIDAFVLPARGALSEHVRSFLGHELFEALELPTSEDSAPEQPFAITLPQAARAAGLPALCILVDPRAYEGQAPGPVAAAALTACRLAVQRGSRRLVLPLLGTGAMGMASSEVLRELLSALREEPELGLEQVVITTLSDDDVALARAQAEEVEAGGSAREQNNVAQTQLPAASLEAPLPAAPLAPLAVAPLSAATPSETPAPEAPLLAAPPEAALPAAPAPNAPPAAPSLPAREAASTAALATVSMNSRARDGENKLGVSVKARPWAREPDEDVRALADVIAAHDRTLPLAIGLFGRSGAGKTSFLDQLTTRLVLLEASARGAAGSGKASAYCKHVVHVNFNAWAEAGGSAREQNEDADGNLWASLVHRILDELAQAMAPRGESADQVREALTQKLTFVQEQLAERERAAETLAKRRGELEDELARLEQERENARKDIASASPRAVMQAAAAVPSVDKLVREATQHWSDPCFARGRNRPLRPARDELQTLRQMQRELAGFAGRLGAAWAWWGKASGWTRTFALGLFALSVLAPFVSAYVRELVLLAGGTARFDAVVWATLGLMLATLAIWAHGFLPYLRQAESVLGLARQAQSAVDAETDRQLAENGSRFHPALARIAELESQIAQVRHDLRKTERQMADLQNQIAQLSAGSQLREFIQESAASDGHLGTMATLRNDFSQLQRFVREVHESSVESAEVPVDRVVIYVDDLDRCPADRVVKVLQAVHRLLDFPLFVTVVSADPRWLLRSLEGHYGAAIAQDFMENLLQIPLTLRPISSKGYQDLLTQLVPVARPLACESNGANAHDTQSAEPETAPAMDIDRDIDPDTLHITAHELALMQHLWGLSLTACATKRFVNLYYLVRAAIPRHELDAFVGTDEAPGSCVIHIFLLGVLIAWPDAAEELFAELQTDARHVRVGSLLQRVEEAHATRGLTGEPSQAPRLVELARTLDLPSRAAAFAEPARRIARFSFRHGIDRRPPMPPMQPAPRPGAFEMQA